MSLPKEGYRDDVVRYAIVVNMNKFEPGVGWITERIVSNEFPYGEELNEKDANELFDAMTKAYKKIRGDKVDVSNIKDGKPDNE